MKVGFIGLGTMGAGIALNAIKGGHELVVSDMGRNVAARHLAAGAQWADTPREVAQQSEIVFTSLPGPAEVESVALGADGLIEGLAEGAIVPMRLGNLTLAELTEAMNRGWEQRDSRSAMILQEERAGAEVRIAADRIDAITKEG